MQHKKTESALLMELESNSNLFNIIQNLPEAERT